jgi:hypothetical protein
MHLLRHRTARQRLTLLYCAMFVVTGALLLVISGALPVHSAGSTTAAAARSTGQNQIGALEHQVAVL